MPCGGGCVESTANPRERCPRLLHFSGLPFTLSPQWVVRTHPDKIYDLDLDSMDTVCQFRRDHQRCCWVRTVVDSRVAEAQRNSVAHSRTGREDPAKTSSLETSRTQLAALLNRVAHTAAHPRERRSLSQRCPPSTLAPAPRPSQAPRNITFHGQPPCVLRIDRSGGTAYRIDGRLALKLPTPAGESAAASGSADDGAALFPVLLAMSAGLSSSHLLQPYPPMGHAIYNTSDSIEQGRPLLMTLTRICKIDGFLLAVYSSFQWVLSPLGNENVSRLVNPHRVKGICATQNSRTSSAADTSLEFSQQDPIAALDGTPVSPRSAMKARKELEVPQHLNISFDVFAAEFASAEAEKTARCRLLQMNDPGKYTTERSRFGLRGKRDAIVARRAERRRLANLERSRAEAFISFLDSNVAGEGGVPAAPAAPETQSRRATLVQIGQITTNSPLPCETCEDPDQHTLSSVLPRGIQWPIRLRSSPVNGNTQARKLTQTNTIIDLAEAFQSSQQ